LWSVSIFVDIYIAERQTMPLANRPLFILLQAVGTVKWVLFRCCRNQGTGWWKPNR